MTEICTGCGAEFAPETGPTHAYMLSSPACWRAYGEVLTREYQDKTLFDAAHRFTVDAYALQHPGLPDERRAYQSVRLHYASLFLIFERGESQARATRLLGQLAKSDHKPLPGLHAPFEITVAEMTAIRIDKHVDKARNWARDSFDKWSILKDETARLISGLEIH